MSLTIFGAAGTSGTVSNNAGFSSDFVIGDTGVFELSLTTADATIVTNGTVRENALFINASGPISALATNQRTASSDMTSLLPSDALGREYFVLGWRQLDSSSPSQLSITAIEDGTEVSFTPRHVLSGFAANETHTVTLNAGESLGLSGFDVTGTRIESSAAVAVFAGARCTQVPFGITACDHIVSQNFGVENYSSDFRMVQTPLAGSGADLIQVIAATDGTEVFIDGDLRGTIDRGEFLVIDNVGNSRITSSNPVQLGQYMRGQGGTRTLGDPAFAILPGTDQWLSSYVFAIPADGEGNAIFRENYLMVVISEGAAGSLLLDNVAVQEGDFDERELLGGFLYGTIAVEGGPGSIRADEPFLAMIAGFDSFDSYLTTVATSFATGASPAPDPTEVAVLPNAPVYEALPRLMANIAHTGSMRQRIGDRTVVRPVGEPVFASQGGAGAAAPGMVWLSASFERLRPRSGDFALADDVRQSLARFQFGYDLPAIVTDTGNIVFGGFVEYQRSSADVTSFFGLSEVSSRALGVGASMTWHSMGGTYVDVVGRYLRLRNSFDTPIDRQSGRAAALSAEVGHLVPLGQGWSVTPQAQLSYASVSLDDIAGPMGETVAFRNGRSVRARLGGVVDYAVDMQGGGQGSLFASANIIRETSFSHTVDIITAGGTSTFEPRRSRTMGELGIGGQVLTGTGGYVDGGLYVSRNLGGGGRTNLRGQIGLNLVW